MGLYALPYIGGKAGYDKTHGAGIRIAKLLPQRTDVYVEPFAGMLGILLQRVKSKNEIVNDKDTEIWNWWLVMRDHHEALLDKLDRTPNSRTELACCQLPADPEDIVEQARRTSVKILYGLQTSTASQSWRRCARQEGGIASWHKVRKRLDAVAYRIRDIQLENSDAVGIIERFQEGLVYCDPPYTSAPGSKEYGVHQFDKPAMTDAVLHSAAQIAISGYADEWDHLDWYRTELPAVSGALGHLHGDSRPKRTEVLWTNFPVNQQHKLF